MIIDSNEKPICQVHFLPRSGAVMTSFKIDFDDIPKLILFLQKEMVKLQNEIKERLDLGSKEE